MELFTEILSDEVEITKTLGMTGLVRFSCALGSKSVANEAKDQLSAYLDASEWEKRHAALLALSSIAQGCSEVISKNLDAMMSMILKGLQDNNPHVRWAACRAIGLFQFCFKGHVLEECHNRVYLALFVVLDDCHPPVQAYGLIALSESCLYINPEDLIPHLDGIVNKLLVLIPNEKQILQLGALKTLTALAFCVKEHFQTYYNAVMPHLKGVLRSADLKSDFCLRAFAIECIGEIGCAVGKEKFREDANQIIQVLMTLQGLQERIDDIFTWKMLHACVRICKCMGKEFLPYLSELIDFFLIQSLKWNDDNWNNKSIEKVMFRDKPLQTGSDFFLMGKLAHACGMLNFCANTLKEDFYPWIPKVVSVLVPLLKFHSDNHARKHAAKALHSMLCSAKVTVEKGIAQDGSESYFLELSDNIIRTFVEALHKERVGDLCVIMLDALNDCLEICGPLLHEGWARLIVDEIKHIITDSSSRKQELIERRKCEDFDDEEADLLKDERELEEDIFFHVTYILQTLIKALKADFLPFLDELSSYLLPMLAKEETTSFERSASIRIFNCLMKEFPEAAIKYYGACLPLILDAINDECSYVRKNALYGLRLWAENDRCSFKHFVGEALPRINKVIMHSKARDECAYDNAVSALGVISQFHSESIDLAQVIPIWLNCLPIKAHLLEAKLNHELVCSMVERS